MLNYNTRLVIFLSALCVMMFIMLFDREGERVEDSAPNISEVQITSVVTAYFFTESESKEAPDETPSVDVKYPKEDIEYLARLVLAEAGNQTVLGQRLVIDTVLNRVDHPAFPNSIREVIDQKNQFSPVSSGSIYRYESTDSIIELINEEIYKRTDPDVVFFRSGNYGPYGVPMYKLGGHYFSSYD